MREKILLLAGLAALLLGMVFLFDPDAAAALLLVAAVSVPAIILFRRATDEKDFITGLFLGALAVRLAFGLMVHVFDWREFFGGDAQTYDSNGSLILNSWFSSVGGESSALRRATSTDMPGWGMNYLVAFLYMIFGRNILAAQSFCAVVGAATAPMVYFCSQKIFTNKRVSKAAAIGIAFFPSFIIWSSQLMKDGLIIFLLAAAITMVLVLQEKFNYAALLLLIFALFGILSLRFYIFYMVAISVVGSFVIGQSSNSASMFRRMAVLILMGMALTYLGVIRNASSNFEQYADLERIQRSRQDLQQSAQSGFGEDVDVSTTEGAITAIPIGLTYLMLAPFPWQVTNLRQLITLPEVLLWWAMIPFMCMGIWYAIRHRLRNAFPILFFSLMLTLAYSIFQGNVGTAYRQRTQIQVFLFIFIAVGFALYKERKEDKKLALLAKQRQFESRLQVRT